MTGLALTLGFGALAQGDDWSRQYAVKGRPEVVVKTDDGSVQVEVGDKGGIEARVETVGWKIAEGEVSITESQTGDRVSLEVKIPRLAWGDHHGLTGRRSITVTLRVPRDADLDVRTGDGAVSVASLAGRVAVSTGDGSIGVEGASGEIRLQTGDGAINAFGIVGRVRAQTGDGHVKVRGRFEALDVQTGDGGIDVEAETGSKMTQEWSLRTGDGGVRLRVPPDFGAELVAHTGDGGIVLDLPITVSGRMGRNDVRGQLGGGGPALRVNTGDGSIRISAGPKAASR
jgi:DUF4097 and DUF4098 domain-containing protein YvlB